MTNNVKARLLSPSEIELWELAKKATLGKWGPEKTHSGWYAEVNGVECRGDFAVWANGHLIALIADARDPIANAALISGANPLTVSALLETLEKTREAAAKLLAHHDEKCRCDRLYNVVLPEHPAAAQTRALLSGFSGDASKEEK